jgi:hypothetical protein
LASYSPRECGIITALRIIGDKAMLKNRFRWSAGITTIIVCMMASTSKGFPVSPWDATPLDINLARIINQDKGEGTDIQKLEDQCLLLLNDYNSPADKGKIYAKIALMYSGHGYSSLKSIRIAKTEEYCWKALEYPLDTLTTCETYSSLSGAQIAPYYERPAEEFARARKEAIVTCLTGLKLALDNNAPNELKEQRVHRPPIVFNYDGDPNSPYVQKRLKEITKYNEELMVEHKKEKLEEQLYIIRRAAIDGCVSLYSSKPPYDTNELEKFARDILNGHEDAIDEIMSKVHELNLQQGHK